MNNLKIPFAIVSFLLVQGAGAVWWSSQIDGRVGTLEAESLNIARENRRYIEQLDWSYQQHANPSQLIYDGPLNTYRNYFEADIVIRTYESLRCQAAFSKIWDFQACQVQQLESCHATFAARF